MGSWHEAFCFVDHALIAFIKHLRAVLAGRAARSVALKERKSESFSAQQGEHSYKHHETSGKILITLRQPFSTIE
jgi:hypothetical protein